MSWRESETSGCGARGDVCMRAWVVTLGRVVSRAPPMHINLYFFTDHRSNDLPAEHVSRHSTRTRGEIRDIERRTPNTRRRRAHTPYTPPVSAALCTPHILGATLGSAPPRLGGQPTHAFVFVRLYARSNHVMPLGPTPPQYPPLHFSEPAAAAYGGGRAGGGCCCRSSLWSICSS